METLRNTNYDSSDLIGGRANISKFIKLALLLGVCASCTTPYKDDIPFGVAPNRAGYIPARMALISCSNWPARSSRLRGQLVNTATADETSRLCADFDQFIASGFDNQPFMKGLSPKFVEKLYAQGGMTTPVVNAVAQQWQARPEDCPSCITPTAFYAASIAPRKQWNVWLSDFSKALKGSDALLIPIVIHNSTSLENNRGLVVARRSAFLTMLLIDTTTGELIWSGGREAEVVSKAFAEDPKAKGLLPPDLDELKGRLFTDALWLGFPGRQIYK